MPKIIKEGERILAHPCSLRQDQINWIRKHPEFKFVKFARDQLDKYIAMMESINETTN